MATSHHGEEKPPGTTLPQSGDLWGDDNDDDIFQNSDSTTQLAQVLGDLRNTLRNQSRVLSSPVRGATAWTDLLPEDKAIMDVVKSKMKALNVKAADMVQELATFFRPIEAYFKLAGIGNMANRLHDDRRVILLESVMGEDCYRAMSGLPPESRATYVAYKKAIED